MASTDRAATAARGTTLPRAAVRTLNHRSEGGSTSLVLTTGGEPTWRLGDATAVDDALSVLAADAISLVAREHGGRLTNCASPTCQAVFLDTSRSRTRKWCDMNTCGNRQKKARMKSRKGS